MAKENCPGYVAFGRPSLFPLSNKSSVLNGNIDQTHFNQSCTVPESLEYISKLIAYINRIQDQCGKVRRLLEVVDENGLVDLAKVQASQTKTL